ncbi:site-specific integrase [Frankia sp. AiPa1]|uniref:tyrosine-type recombinase/integrase n=1 Tax=Frankia sp. AiPa1 TaxID=573492 RepID=UPI00203507E8|nr:site-specific integrase [Frankia sp. AiPa1]
MTTRVIIRPKARERDASLIELHVKPFFGHREIDSIDQADVRDWIVTLVNRRVGSGSNRERTLSPATVQKAYQILKSMMNAAVDARLIRRSLCYNIDLPKVDHQEMRFLTPADVMRLAQIMPDRFYALVLVCCYGGLRIGEAAGLERQHIQGSKIQVVQGVTEVSGQGLLVGPLKTRHSRRTVAVPEPVAEALRRHLRKYVDLRPDAPVFSVSGTRLRVNHFRKRHWAKAIKDAGLAPLRIHDMRHTAVALWIATGAPVLQVSRRAGHGSVSFTLDRYGHLYEEADDALLTGLSATLAASQRQSATPDAAIIPFRRIG